MPGFVLHQGATVLCMHGGQAQATAPSPRVKVGGQLVATQVAPWIVGGCPYVTGTTPTPCVNAQWVSAATRVTANGVPVLLRDSQAVCVPNGTGLNVLVTQIRVRGI